MAVTTTPYDPVYEPTACTAAPRLGTEPKRPIDEEPLGFVADRTLSTILETYSILLEVCNALACSDLMKDYPMDLKSPENISALIHNSYDAASISNSAARLIRRVLIGGEL